MRTARILSANVIRLIFVAMTLTRATAAELTNVNEVASPPPVKTAVEVPKTYVLRPNDVVLVRVFQESELTTQVRISEEGCISMPLLGTIKIASNTLEQAATLIRDLLDKDYLVNPQVFVVLAEGGGGQGGVGPKQRFTVLGQVRSPGHYQFQSGEPLDLLQAIATAGSYTGIANPRKITVQRMVDGEKKTFKLDAKAMAEGKSEKPFQILPNDTITVGERWL